MRSSAIALIVCCAISSASSAQERPGPDQALQGTVRSLSVLVALDAACSKHVAVNRAAVRKMYDAMYRVAEKTWDEEIFGDALEAENTRRRDEVAATGEEHWCRYQEGYLKHTGKGSLFYR